MLALVLVVVLAILAVGACIAVGVWVHSEMKKDKREMRRRWKKVLRSVRASDQSAQDRIATSDAALSQLGRKVQGVQQGMLMMSRKDDEIVRKVQGVQQGMLMMSKKDDEIARKVQGVQQGMRMMSRKDDELGRQISQLSVMQPFLDVARVDASGISMAKDQRLCIDAQCMQAPDISKLRDLKLPAALPPIGSVWRCDTVKVDKLSSSQPDIAPFPVTFRVEGNSVPSYPLSIRFTEIVRPGDVLPIPLEVDPTNGSSNAPLNFYPYMDTDRYMAWKPQRRSPISFADGYAVGKTCTFNFIGYISTSLGDNSFNHNTPAVFTRIS
jgi:hypothetical protein